MVLAQFFRVVATYGMEKRCFYMRKTYNSKAFSDKYRVYKYLYRGTRFKKYLPDTVTFTKRNLTNMMDKYQNVYVKPNVGSGERDL
jgi:hypothetical protein